MKQILNQLFEHKKLSRDQAKEVLVNISKGVYNEAQIASFITVYLMRSISEHELLGFRDALLDLCVPVDVEGQETIDLCGTGGDGKNTFNISTLSSFVVAGAGYKVTKHGNYGVSSKCGSSDLLETLGYKFTNDTDALKKQLDVANICFFHAPLFHPALKSVGPIRKQLGLKTFFNMLGPLVNPSKPKAQMAGVFNLELARLYAYIFQQQDDKKYSVVHSMDGYDEISLTGDVKIKSRTRDITISPDEMGLHKIHAHEIHGGETKDEAADIFMKVIKGAGSQAQQEAVYANAGLAIHTIDATISIQDAVEKAKETVLKGNAFGSLKKLLDLAA